MKICTVCKQLLEFHAYDKNKLTKDGRASQCKECTKRGKRWNARQKKYALVRSAGGACRVCGYSKCLAALQFHHPNSDKEEIVSRLMRNRFDKALAEAQKCIVLCANCHAEVHAPVDYEGYQGTRLMQWISQSLL